LDHLLTKKWRTKKDYDLTCEKSRFFHEPRREGVLYVRDTAEFDVHTL
jgi:hypothetical protein